MHLLSMCDQPLGKGQFQFLLTCCLQHEQNHISHASLIQSHLSDFAHPVSSLQSLQTGYWKALHKLQSGSHTNCKDWQLNETQPYVRSTRDRVEGQQVIIRNNPNLFTKQQQVSNVAKCRATHISWAISSWHHCSNPFNKTCTKTLTPLRLCIQ